MVPIKVTSADSTTTTTTTTTTTSYRVNQTEANSEFSNVNLDLDSMKIQKIECMLIMSLF